MSKTIPKTRRMWTNAGDYAKLVSERSDGQLVSKTKWSERDFRIALVPLHNEGQLLAAAAHAGGIRIEQARAALTAIGVLPKERRNENRLQIPPRHP